MSEVRCPLSPIGLRAAAEVLWDADVAASANTGLTLKAADISSAWVLHAVSPK